MEIKDLDLRPYYIPKVGKLKEYSNIKDQNRVVFFRCIIKNSHLEHERFFLKVWFTSFGLKYKKFKPNELGNDLFEKLPNSNVSIPAEKFKFLIQ